LNKLANLFIITAPSGCGKTTLVSALSKKMKQKIKKSVSYTTRSKRSNEKNDEDYHFISVAEFQQKIQSKDFLEYAKIYDCYYGTCKKWVLKQLSQGIDVILEIDWQGARQIKQQIPESISIFILPPSISTLKDRLYKRKQDTSSSIKQRLALAQSEISHYTEFDYLLVNNELEKAVNDLTCIVLAARSGQAIQIQKYHDLLEDLLKKR
jgi:guanylate kinase